METASTRRVAANATLFRFIRRRAFIYGLNMAKQQGCRMTELFDLTLGGDLARRSILRRLRRENPGVPYLVLDHAVELELFP